MSDLNFRIESSAKAYEVLASNLYSDKVSAVIRELSCNAADAHAEAGISEIPFEVDLPKNNNGANYFRVRDFGTGLNAEQIEDVFTVFFSSTKVGSKSYTGAFGLGCKSPFAITDSFFVNSYINGKKYFYHCHKNSGIPAISFLKEEPTNQKSGLEIIVPLNSFSGDYWIEKATDIFEYFKTRPKVNHKMNYFNQSDSYLYGDHWEITKNRGTWVVMSNVKYPLDTTKLDENIVNRESHHKNTGIAYHLPARSIEVTPSREGISYTKETINFLNEHIAKINKSFIQSIQDEIQKAPSMMLAKIVYLNLHSKYYSTYFGIEKFFSPTLFYWNDRQISPNRNVFLQIEHPETIEIGFFYKPHKFSSNVKKPLFTNTDLPMHNSYENMLFIINDTKASQESIKAWANRKLKSVSANTITFIVVREEYKNILIKYNSIKESNIIKCSEQNLYKISRSSYGNKNNASQNILMYTYNIITNQIESSNEKSEKDLISDLIDEKNNVYIIEYDSMAWAHPDQIIIGPYQDGSAFKLGNFSEQVISLARNSANTDKPISLDNHKLLLIKKLKKNQKFLKRYEKENKMKFVSYLYAFNKAFERHIAGNPEVLQYIADSFAISFLTGYGASCIDDTFPLWEKANEPNYNFKINYFCKFINFWSNNYHKHEDLEQICNFLVKHECGKGYKNISKSIEYLYYSVYKSQREDFQNMIVQNYQNAINIISLIEKLCEKYPIMFAEEDVKTEKILECYLDGKI